MRALLNEIKKTIVFLGKTTEEGKIQFYATGFLVNIQNIFHLVTAKHVVVDPRTGKFVDSRMLAFFQFERWNSWVTFYRPNKEEYCSKLDIP